MKELTGYAGRWVALAGDVNVVASGDTADQVRRLAAEADPLARPKIVWVSPHPPHVTLPAWPIDELHRLLPESGVWLAGGAVRDILMNRVPHDWDFVVSGSGLDLGRTVANALVGAYYPLDQERKTGRAIVTDPESGGRVTLDFATLRGPDIVADLQARDFTVNAMALTLDGELVDPTGGRQDLSDRKLRMVQVCCFQDDPARLLRAVRLGVELGFDLELGTRNRVRAEAGSIIGIAPERVRAELVKLLAQPVAPRGLCALAELELLPHVVPEIALGSVDSRDYTSAARAVALLAFLGQAVATITGRVAQGAQTGNAPPDWAWTTLSDAFAVTRADTSDYISEPVSADLSRGHLLQWAALFLGAEPASSRTSSGGEEAEANGGLSPRKHLAANRMTHLRFSRAAIEFVDLVVARADSFRMLAQTATGEDPSSPAGLVLNRRAIYRYFRQTREAGIAAVVLSLASTMARAGTRLDRLAWQRHCSVARTLATAYFSRRDELVDPVPILIGYDLMALGIPEGPAMGQILEELREAQAAGEVSSTAEAHSLVRRFLSSWSGGAGVGTC